MTPTPQACNSIRWCVASFGCILFLLGAVLFPALVLADGGAVQLSQQVGAVRLTVMTDPVPLRVGAIDFSILIQDAHSGNIRSAGVAEVVLRQADDPPLEIHGTATQALATNKLLRSAQMEVPRSGRWEWELRYVDSGKKCVLQGVFQVVEQRGRWAAAWPWLIAPVFPIGLYVMAECLAARRRSLR